MSLFKNDFSPITKRFYGMIVANWAKRWQATGAKSSVLSDAALKNFTRALCREILRDKDARFSCENLKNCDQIQVTVSPQP